MGPAMGNAPAPDPQRTQGGAIARRLSYNILRMIIISKNLRIGVERWMGGYGGWSRGVGVDLAIIGAGPQGLTLAAHWAARLGQTGQRLAVFDPSGQWLTAWRRQFAAQEIPHLRSPAVHHPDPDPYALRRFAQGRPGELFPPYDLPGTQLFEEFCRAVVERWQLGQTVVPEAVVALEPPRRGRRVFWLHLSSGTVVMARRVAIATNRGQFLWPAWAEPWRGRCPWPHLQTVADLDLRQWSSLEGQRIAIVGGGQSAAHLAVGALHRGALVTLMARRPLQERLFDADPGWLGPKYLKGFEREADWHERSRLIQRARNGGSITPALRMELRRWERWGALRVWENCPVQGATWTGRLWQLTGVGDREAAVDRVWLATGCRFTVDQNPLLTPLREQYPTPLVEGVPMLDRWCRWPGCEAFVLGALAALQVGPVARNLAGGRMASDRVLAALTKRGVGRSRRIA